jgi:ankyrin repeat protein
MKKEKTELHYAVQQYNKSKLELLLTRMTKEEINQADKCGFTALHLAAMEGYADIVELLLKHENIDVNLTNKNGWTALHVSVIEGNKDLVKLLLQHKKTDVNLFNKNGLTALHLATEKGRIEIVKLLLQHKNIDVNLFDENGNTALNWAGDEVHIEIAKLLLHHKNIDVNLFDKSGNTSLHVYVIEKNKGLVKLLLQHKNIDVNLFDKSGNTSLHLAAKNGDIEIVELLLSHKNIDINMCNQDSGETVLHCAVLGENEELLKLLLKKMSRESINEVDQDMQTALCLAVQTGFIEGVKLLLEEIRQELISIRDDNYNTHLHIAAAENHRELVKLLIKSGYYVLNAKNNDGEDIWTYYHPDQEANREIVELLIKHGAKYPDGENSGGNLARIVSSIQGAHSQGRLAQDEYNKFKEGKDETNIRGQLKKNADVFISELKKANDQLTQEDHIKMVKDLIEPKYVDIKEGQGKKFIVDVSRFAGFEISKDLEEQLLKKNSDIKEDLEKIVINLENLKKAIDNLTPDKKAQLAKYSQDKIDETIKHYTKNAIKPFDGFDITTKDFFGVFGAKIVEKIEKKEDIGDVLLDTLKEILDAGTMYGSGGASCATGMVNKMFSSSAWLFDDEIKYVAKEDFEFKGFKVDYDALLAQVIIKLLKESKANDLVNRILKYKIGYKHKFTSIEVQQIASKVYEILKETKINQESPEDLNFSDIVHYGQEDNVLKKTANIEDFCKQLDYRTLSDQTYGGIIKKEESADESSNESDDEYIINKNKVDLSLTLSYCQAFTKTLFTNTLIEKNSNEISFVLNNIQMNLDFLSTKRVRSDNQNQEEDSYKKQKLENQSISQTIKFDDYIIIEGNEVELSGQSDIE